MSADTYELPVQATGLPNLRVAILGAGKMGGILLQAFLKNNLLLPEQIVATVQHPDRAQALSVQFGVEVGTDNLAAAQHADVILLGVKPTQVPAVIAEIAPVLIVIKLEEFNYPGATAIAVIMLAIAFLMLLAINLTQAWSRRRFGHV